MKLSIYDMDKTITKKASWTAWLFFYARREAPARLLLAPLLALPSIAFLMGFTDRKGLKQAAQALMMGRRVARARVERAAEAFAADFGARMELPGALEAIAADRAAGREVWLATASCRYFVEALARRWGMETVIATENVWDGDHLSNRIHGENCYEMGKLRMILARLERRPEEVVFSSDHISDLPVLDWADVPVAANPCAELRGIAERRGWQIRDWRQATASYPPSSPRA
ncbi:HAD-IB family phosphatase [Sandaracinobacter sp. RS1-74]|uniref:HAD family hydrolase n=1 Tax=Sandaracinobacteroides sayramensis TaxID=2913411 RepID=UPI001EDAA4F4|nr:HAD-IB family phosphatase [Sandaracinobacteroides sayramensis]MCG2840832.1 HAD-IB family phosphatase [Sandaracinobacteroides sayramensis]